MSQTIIWTIATITVLGFLLALVLYLVAKKFKVEEDPRIDEVEKAMPGANCGGCGDCVAACQFDAIHMDPATGLPVVDEAKCTACGACAKACPKRIIELRAKGPRGMREYVSCINQDKGPAARKACANACIGCGICVKTCTHEAIVLENNVAYIDPAKCKLCRECEAVCPTGAIHGVNFPKPLDKEAVKERIKLRQQKAKEAAADAVSSASLRDPVRANAPEAATNAVSSASLRDPVRANAPETAPAAANVDNVDKKKEEA